MNEEELVTRGKDLSLKIVKLMQEEVDSHEDMRGSLIGLFSLAKVSASVIRATQELLGDKREVFGLFMDELTSSLEHLDAVVASDEIINKAKGKP